jgi:phage tail-like protein
MDETIIRYLVLRDQHHWDGSIDQPKLVPRNDGALILSPPTNTTSPDSTIVSSQSNTGELRVDAADAGAGERWERIWLEAEIPLGTSVTLTFFVSHDKTTQPADPDWQMSASLDVFLPALVNNSIARFLWLRIRLSSSDPAATPALLQVQAATAAPSYLDYLPRIYRRQDTANAFMERWLALLRSEMGDWEQDLDAFPRQLHARSVDEADLPALASWLALDLPAKLDAHEQRQLLADAPALYRRRGTPIGIRLLALRLLGVKIHILEAFRQRAIWQLGQGAGLGIDTGLAAGFPDGLIVPGFTYADPAFSGLRGDYYEGTNFEIFRHSRPDAKIEFLWAGGSPGFENFPNDLFSVRWTGQVRPRYDETYTFRTLSDDGVRLWVNGRLLIDNWTDHPPTTDAGQLKLEAGRWYPLVLEYYEKGGDATITLSWSSASQRSEIIPQECLYPLLDDSVKFAPENATGRTLIEVGNAVVGQARPQTAEAFGEPLSDDYAHLFTVFVPASQVPTAAERQALQDMIESEKPAHTDYSLCLVEPKMRVGVQSRLGMDSIVGGPPPPLVLDQVRLGLDSYIAEPEPGKIKLRVGQTAHLGMNTIINKGVL